MLPETVPGNQLNGQFSADGRFVVYDSDESGRFEVYVTPYPWTGERWQVERGPGEGVPSLREQADAAKASEAERIRRAPLVEAALAAFPEAEFVEDDAAPRGERNWSRH